MDWKDISLRKYAKIQALIPFEWEDIDKQCQVLAILYGGKPEDYLKLSRQDFVSKVASTKFLYQSIPQQEPCFVFRAGGVKYVANQLISTIKTEEFIDLTAWSKDEKTVLTNLHNILAIFCRPQAGWFKRAETDRNKIAEHLADNMPPGLAVSLSAFFLKLYERLLTATQSYTIQALKKTIRNQEKQLRRAEHGDGSKRSTISQEATALNGTTTLT